MKGHKAHHHGKKAGGGRTGLVASGNPDVLKEAENKADYNSGEKKHGGRAKKRAAGGKVAASAATTKTIGLMTGGAVRPRGDRPGRKTGGPASRRGPNRKSATGRQYRPRCRAPGCLLAKLRLQ